MIQIRQSLRLITGAIIAFALAHYLQWQESYWIVISSLIGLHIANTPLLRHKNIFLLITGVVATTTAVIANYLTSSVLLLALFLFLTTFASVNIGLLWPLIWGGTFVSNYFANLSSVSTTYLQGGSQRAESILLGFGIAIFLHLLFSPNRLRRDAKLMLAKSLDDLSLLSESIFDCYLTTDYANNSFFYDQQLHIKRRDYLCSIHSARQLIAKMKSPLRIKYKKVLDDLEHCYEILLSLGTLIYRVNDHSTFEIVLKEFSAISKNLYSIFTGLRTRLLYKKSPKLPDELKENIYQLEDVNRSALSVVASDGLVFPILIQDLHKLDEMLGLLTTDISAAQDAKK